MTIGSSLEYLHIRKRQWKVKGKGNNQSVFEMFLNGKITDKQLRLWCQGKIKGNELMLVDKNGKDKSK